MDFVALDFETANGDRASACALGIVVVQGGRIVDRASWLIRPPSLYFAPINISIHGITSSDVRDKPNFAELWPDLHGYLAGRMLVAHNAAFDMGVLRGVLDVYRIPYPRLLYTCTLKIARRTWPGLFSYSLANVAAHLGIGFGHHVAEEDAYASAEIARQACSRLGASSLEALMRCLEITHGQLFPGGYFPARSLPRRSSHV